MSVWVWVSLAIAGFFAVSLLVGLAVAAVLANIGREFSRLIEFEPLGAALENRGAAARRSRS